MSFDETDSNVLMKKGMMKEKTDNDNHKLMKVSLSLNNNKFYELMGLLRFICVEDL